VNQGQAFADSLDVDLDALKVSNFASPSGSFADSFGGPATGFMHFQQNSGELESTPHGSMHGAVGGFMGRFNTAGLDPIFWLHHANIDRLWDVWIQRDASFVNPPQLAWLRGVSFDFFDVTGGIVTMNVEDVIDSTQPPLDYQYEDVSDPIPQPFGAVPPAPDDAMEQPELITASDEPLDIEMDETPVRTLLTAPNLKADDAVESFGAHSDVSNVYLRIENVTGSDVARAVDVYIGLPDGANPSDHEDHRAGRLPLFGLPEASEAKGPHAGSGLSFSLEVTKHMDRIQSNPGDDNKEYPVTFVAVGAADTPIRVGRISIYAK